MALIAKEASDNKMQDKQATEKHTNLRIWPIVFLFVLLMGSLYLLADATRSETSFEQLHYWLFPFNVLLLAIFLILIVVNIARLGTQVVRRLPGSRLTLRLLLMFVLLAIVPVGIVYTFSMWLIQEGVDSWFDADVEKALQDSVINTLVAENITGDLTSLQFKSNTAIEGVITSVKLDSGTVIAYLI